MQPTVLVFTLEEIIENDFERPRLQQTGDTFSGNGEQAEP